MRVPFLKMQGAGNDFVVLDETRALFGLQPEHYRLLADRHFGVGADQILSLRPAPAAGVDFAYVIHNADGSRSGNCGNGARCLGRFIRLRGLSAHSALRVQTGALVLGLQFDAHGRVGVDMGAPQFALERIPFLPLGAPPRHCADWALWPLAWPNSAGGAAGGSTEVAPAGAEPPPIEVALVSMGNPHAVWRVDEIEHAPLAAWGQALQQHPSLPERVNLGCLQVLNRQQAMLRVFERGVGETLACGSGACAAAVAGIRLGWFDETVELQLPGGTLHVHWPLQALGLGAAVQLSGPAEPVFEGVIDLPDLPPTAQLSPPPHP